MWVPPQIKYFRLYFCLLPAGTWRPNKIKLTSIWRHDNATMSERRFWMSCASLTIPYIYKSQGSVVICTVYDTNESIALVMEWPSVDNNGNDNAKTLKLERERYRLVIWGSLENTLDGLCVQTTRVIEAAAWGCFTNLSKLTIFQTIYETLSRFTKFRVTELNLDCHVCLLKPKPYFRVTHDKHKLSALRSDNLLHSVWTTGARPTNR